MTDLLSVKRRLKNIEDNINMKIGIRNQLQSDIDSSTKKVNNFETQILLLDKVLKVFQQIVDVKKEKIKGKFEKIVSKGLKIVYDDTYGYELEYDIKRDDLVANPYVYNEIDNKKIITEIENARGGGIVDVVSFLSRIIVISARKDLRQILCADEPFKNVGAGNMENVSRLLKWIASILKIQFIIVTHEKELEEAADKVFHVVKEKGISYVS